MTIEELYVEDIKRLTLSDRLRLAALIVADAAAESRGSTQTVIDEPEGPPRPTAPAAPQQMTYGQFGGPGMSTDDDFLIAEWRGESDSEEID